MGYVVLNDNIMTQDMVLTNGISHECLNGSIIIEKSEYEKALKLDIGLDAYRIA